MVASSKARERSTGPPAIELKESQAERSGAPDPESVVHSSALWRTRYSLRGLYPTHQGQTRVSVEVSGTLYVHMYRQQTFAGRTLTLPLTKCRTALDRTTETIQMRENTAFVERERLRANEVDQEVPQLLAEKCG